MFLETYDLKTQQDITHFRSHLEATHRSANDILR